MFCTNSKCDSRTWLCGRCRKMFPMLAASLDEERRNRRRNNRGSTMYGRNYASTKAPKGASGGFNPRSGRGHGTQYYDDGTRVSWDTDGQGDSNRHWTNQNVGKGNPRRHQRPPHAK